jgi:ABC-2 type transport system ATP-binding protein
LAQALLHNPKVLILDEPTSGLDPIQVAEMRNVITDLGKEKTVMLSTHIMQEVEAMCERVIMINRGNIVADDNLKELKNKYQTSLEDIFKQLTQNVDAL